MKAILDSWFLALHSRSHRVVEQVARPAVSPIAQSAVRVHPSGPRDWKLATQQNRKSALPGLALCVVLVAMLPAAHGATLTVTSLDDSGSWFLLFINIHGTGGSIDVIDADQATQPHRFYRVGKTTSP